jgi:hypothetical protein
MPYQHRHGEEDPEAGRQRGAEECDGGDQQGARGERPVLQQIAERQQEQQADGIAELAEGHDQGRAALGDAEGMRDRREQRLTVVQVGRGGPAGHGEHKDHQPQPLRDVAGSDLLLAYRALHAAVSRFVVVVRSVTAAA